MPPRIVATVADPGGIDRAQSLPWPSKAKFCPKNVKSLLNGVALEPVHMGRRMMARLLTASRLAAAAVLRADVFVVVASLLVSGKRTACLAGRACAIRLLNEGSAESGAFRLSLLGATGRVWARAWFRPETVAQTRKEAIYKNTLFIAVSPVCWDQPVFSGLSVLLAASNKEPVSFCISSSFST